MTILSFTNIGIDGFRGLRKLELTDLGRVNILVGSNNSGKTSVLEALSILCQPCNPNEWLAMVRRRDFGRLDESIVQSFRWCFTRVSELLDPDLFIEAGCKFSCEGRFSLQSLEVRYSEFLGIPPAEDRTSTSVINDASRRLRQKDLTLMMEDDNPMRGLELTYFPKTKNNQLDLFSSVTGLKNNNFTLRIWEDILPIKFRFGDGYKIPSETLTPYSYQLNPRQVRSQSKQIFQLDSPSVLELLKDFDADIEKIEIASFHGERPAIYIKHSKLGIAPISVFGDAMRRSVLLASTLLSLKEGGILLIDEVEAGIHVGALGKVFEWLSRVARQLDVQIFVTTHSLEAVDALLAASNPQDNEDIVAYRLSQTPEATLSKRFAGDFLHRLRYERGLDLR
jgi:AAA15 family ATPase/GTPase